MKSTRDLQELVELVTFLQKAVERQGRNVEVTGHLADLLSHYASLLASQGSLATAVNYLGNSQNEQVSSLRERLYVSLGHKPAYAQPHQARSRHPSTRQSFSSYPNQYNQTPVQPNPYNPPSQINNYQFNTGLPNPSNNQPWSTQSAYNPMPPVKPFSPGPTVPPLQPNRPPSVGSAHGGTGLPKSKYVLDPSVTTNPYGSSRNSYGGNPLLPSMSNPNNFQTNALSSNNPGSNSLYGSPTPLNPSVPPNPLQPSSLVPGVGSTNPTRLVPTQAPSGFQNQDYNQGTDANSFGQSAMNFLPPNAAPGWNDPPVVSKPNKPQQKPEANQQEPITHPIFGVAPTQQYPNNNGFLDPNQNMPYNQGSNFAPPPTGGAAPPQMFTPSMATSSSGNFNQPMSFNTNAINQTNFNQNAINAEYTPQTSNVQAEKPAPVQKGPIPEEHIHMKTVLDELRTKCSCAANNPQTKRKIDDVAKKLEALYDLLREHKLSPTALASLHQIVQLVQVGDYASGLSIHTQLVSGPDFSQIATFMPGIKVLLQCALQLQVYIR